VGIAVRNFIVLLQGRMRVGRPVATADAYSDRARWHFASGRRLFRRGQTGWGMVQLPSQDRLPERPDRPNVVAPDWTRRPIDDLSADAAIRAGLPTADC